MRMCVCVCVCNIRDVIVRDIYKSFNWNVIVRELCYIYVFSKILGMNVKF